MRTTRRRTTPLKLQDTTYSRDGRSLTEVTNALASEGWGEQATPLDGALVRCEACGEASPASELEVHALCRVEGASDPADMAAVVAIVCPKCSSHDTLVLTYGPEASSADADVLLALPDPPPPSSEGVSK